MRPNPAVLTLALGIFLLSANPMPSQAREDKSRVLTFEAAGTVDSPLSRALADITAGNI